MQSLQIVKIGTSSIFSNGQVHYSTLDRIGYDIAVLKYERKTDSVLVVSGAIRLGMIEQGIVKKPNKPIELQSYARVGQPLLMQFYGRGLNKGLRRYNAGRGAERKIVVSQYLVTYHNLENNSELRNIIEGLKYDINKEALPLINYNDGVDAIEVTRDNDALAAKIAKSMLADRLVILSDTDGLLDQNGSVVRRVTDINESIEALCRDTGNGTGGIMAKLDAGKLLLREGIPVIIGNAKYGLVELLDNVELPTYDKGTLISK